MPPTPPCEEEDEQEDEEDKRKKESTLRRQVRTRWYVDWVLVILNYPPPQGPPEFTTDDYLNDEVEARRIRGKHLENARKLRFEQAQDKFNKKDPHPWLIVNPKDIKITPKDILRKTRIPLWLPGIFL